MSVFKTDIRELVGLTWNTFIHQESKIRIKWEMIWVTLLSNPCAIHNANNSFIYELAKKQLSVQTETNFYVLYVFQISFISLKFLHYKALEFCDFFKLFYFF